MKTFADLAFKAHSNPMFGVQAEMEFDNGYGVSVIMGAHSYGGPDGLYELAIIADNRLCYNTPITDDVLGYLTPEEVTKKMELVQALPRRKR